MDCFVRLHCPVDCIWDNLHSRAVVQSF
jgi:hypothetical protein